MLWVFARYVVIQVVAYGVDMVTFLFLLHLSAWQPILANAAAKVLAGTFAFLAHRRVTFAVHRAGGAWSQSLRYAALLLVNIPISSLLLGLALTVVPHPTAAKILSDVIAVGFTFWLSRRYVFTAGLRASKA
jgi:putative flippase GtrA